MGHIIHQEESNLFALKRLDPVILVLLLKPFSHMQVGQFLENQGKVFSTGVLSYMEHTA